MAAPQPARISFHSLSGDDLQELKTLLTEWQNIRFPTAGAETKYESHDLEKLFEAWQTDKPAKAQSDKSPKVSAGTKIQLDPKSLLALSDVVHTWLGQFVSVRPVHIFASIIH